MRTCFVCANPFALNAFLAGPIEALAEAGCEVTVALNTHGGQVSQSVLQHARVVHVDLQRPIAPLHDVRALVQLWRLMRRERFDLVHSITPKSGLLAMMASRAAGVRARLHTFGGQVWATRRGPMRRLLRAMDRVIASCATQVLTDSPSQREFIAGEGVTRADRIRVLGQGSICGVDTWRFRPDAAVRAQVRESIGLCEGDLLVAYVGRLHPDKGMRELGLAFERLAVRDARLHLALVGPDEAGLAVLQAGVHAGRSRLHVLGHSPHPERMLAAADIFCMPSYREGFGMSLLEAAAAGVPAVATRIYGIVDAVEEGVSGLLVPPHDVDALTDALACLVNDPSLRERLSRQARERAEAAFSRARLLREWLELYGEQARRLGNTVPPAVRPGES